MCVGHVILEGLVSLIPPSPLTLTRFLPPLVGFSEGRDLMETSYLGLSVSWSLTFCIISGYGYLFHLLQEEASLMMAEQGTDLRV